MNDIYLDALLGDIWEQRVVPLFSMGRIQTERHLQAYLFMWLKEGFNAEPSDTWDVWVEPQFYFKDEEAKKKEKMYKPDLVVTRDSGIAGIIELKFSPQERNAEKNFQAALGDIGKLDTYRLGKSTWPKLDKPITGSVSQIQNGDYFLLELDPRDGRYREPVYSRTDCTLYAFFGVARYGERAHDILPRESPHAQGHVAQKMIRLLETSSYFPNSMRAR